MLIPGDSKPILEDWQPSLQSEIGHPALPHSATCVDPAYVPLIFVFEKGERTISSLLLLSVGLEKGHLIA